LLGKSFNAIVVAPSNSLRNGFCFDDEDILDQFNESLFREVMKNVLAYRLAHKYLAKTGIVILSCSEK